MQNELFEKTPVKKAYFILSMPVVFSMVISLVYNMVDTYFIAQTGDTALIAGVSLCAPVFSLMIAFGDIFGLGGSSVISRLFGQHRDEDGKRLSSFCFWSSIAFGLVILIIMLVFRSGILSLLGTDAGTLQYASSYYTIIVIGCPLIILSFTPTNILRTEGAATASMTGNIVGTVVNIILDPIMISYLGWGAAGAATATIIGYLCANAYFVWYLLRKSQKLSMNIRLAKVSRFEFGQIIAIGIPASLTNIAQSYATTLTNRFLLPYGTDQIAAMGIAMKAGMIASFMLVGFAFGSQPLTGYSYGARDFKRLRETLKFSYLFECSLAAGISIVLAVFAPQVISFFISDPAIIASGALMLRMQLIGMTFNGFVMVSTCMFQSAGKALDALLLSISRQGIVFTAVIIIGSSVAGYTGVIAAQAVSDIITAVLAAVLLYFGLFKEIRGKGKELEIS